MWITLWNCGQLAGVVSGFCGAVKKREEKCLRGYVDYQGVTQNVLTQLMSVRLTQLMSVELTQLMSVRSINK